MKLNSILSILLGSFLFANSFDSFARVERKKDADSIYVDSSLDYINPDVAKAELRRSPDRILSVDERMQKEDQEQAKWKEEHKPVNPPVFIDPEVNELKQKVHNLTNQLHHSVRSLSETLERKQKESQRYEESLNKREERLNKQTQLHAEALAKMKEAVEFQKSEVSKSIAPPVPSMPTPHQAEPVKPAQVVHEAVAPPVPHHVEAVKPAQVVHEAVAPPPPHHVEIEKPAHVVHDAVAPPVPHHVEIEKPAHVVHDAVAPPPPPPLPVPRHAEPVKKAPLTLQEQILAKKLEKKGGEAESQIKKEHEHIVVAVPPPPPAPKILVPVLPPLPPAVGHVEPVKKAPLTLQEQILAKKLEKKAGDAESQVKSEHEHVVAAAPPPPPPPPAPLGLVPVSPPLPSAPGHVEPVKKAPLTLQEQILAKKLEKKAGDAESQVKSEHIVVAAPPPPPPAPLGVGPVPPPLPPTVGLGDKAGKPAMTLQEQILAKELKKAQPAEQGEPSKKPLSLLDEIRRGKELKKAEGPIKQLAPNATDAQKQLEGLKKVEKSQQRIAEGPVLFQKLDEEAPKLLEEQKVRLRKVPEAEKNIRDEAFGVKKQNVPPAVVPIQPLENEIVVPAEQGGFIPPPPPPPVVNEQPVGGGHVIHHVPPAIAQEHEIVVPAEQGGFAPPPLAPPPPPPAVVIGEQGDANVKQPQDLLGQIRQGKKLNKRPQSDEEADVGRAIKNPKVDPPKVDSNDLMDVLANALRGRRAMGNLDEEADQGKKIMKPKLPPVKEIQVDQENIIPNQNVGEIGQAVIGQEPKEGQVKAAPIPPAPPPIGVPPIVELPKPQPNRGNLLDEIRKGKELKKAIAEAKPVENKKGDPMADAIARKIQERQDKLEKLQQEEKEVDEDDDIWK